MPFVTKTAHRAVVSGFAGAFADFAGLDGSVHKQHSVGAPDLLVTASAQFDFRNQSRGHRAPYPFDLKPLAPTINAGIFAGVRALANAASIRASGITGAGPTVVEVVDIQWRGRPPDIAKFGREAPVIPLATVHVTTG